MRIEELRIGFWYLYEGIELQLSQERLAYILDVGGEYEPIELTEEWLERFGFKNGTIENEGFSFTAIYYDCWNIVYKEKESYGDSDCFLRTYVYVHQLQNLYFALTGEELTLKD